MCRRKLPAASPGSGWLIALLLALMDPPASAEPLAFVPWQADFHMHLRSQAAFDAEAATCALLGKDACKLNTEHPVRDGSDAIVALDEVDARKGVVLSMAYLYGSPFLASRHYDVARMTRAENEWVARQVGAQRDRLVGFFGVDPLSASAPDEVRYWLRDGRLSGLKIHFANSEVSLRDPEQVKKIAVVVGLIGEKGWPINFHFSTGGDFGAQDTEIFMRNIMRHAGNSWVQMSHAAGFGGTEKTMFRCLEVFAAHLQRDDPATRHIIFDLASVVLPATTPEEAAELVALMRKIGLWRFVVGSDYDGHTPKETDELDREKLPLSQQEWRSIVHNCVPWVCQKGIR